MAKKLIATFAFVGALLWNYCALAAYGSEPTDPSRLSILATTICMAAMILSSGVGVWLLGPRRMLRWSVGFVLGVILALAVGPALAFTQPPTSGPDFDLSSLEGAIATLLGLAVMILPLRRAAHGATAVPGAGG